MPPDGPPRVLLAPDKFKGSSTAPEVAAALGRGLRAARPDLVVDEVPVADGGDGTLDAAVAGGFTLVPTTAAGPTGEPVRTAYARRGDVAVVEMAAVCGLGLLPGGVPAPMTATSRGVGEVVRRAVDDGCRRVLVGIGGSASTDGGAGLLVGLGAVVRDGDGRPVPEGGDGLRDARVLDLSGLPAGFAEVELAVACDVDNPLLGPHGAAAVYGPQKGAVAEQVVALDHALGVWADVLARAVGTDHRDGAGSGAAGGVGLALLALGADLSPGIDLVLDLVGFDDRLVGADLVVVGEGALDEQTLRGKAPAGVAARATAAGVPVVAVCGRRDLSDDDARRLGVVAVHALTDLEPDPDVCVRDAAALLERLAPRVLASLPA
ncbi:glycerate kinase [Solicola sp. PLA-1-18]|uniref:glycerate kinase n=1 Tax=Solicola sp. PLA-1-18 TaxID=3380532 RepID=UPI003B769DB7